MSKVIVYMFIGLLVATLITARSTDKLKDSCGRHGDSCVPVNNCCEGLGCHRFANRCYVIITAEELQKGKANLRKTDSKFKV